MSPPPLKIPRRMPTPQSRRSQSLKMLLAKVSVIGDVINLWIPGEPPTVTHQAKKIVRCGRFPKLADSPSLRAAINCYLAQIAPCPREPFDEPVHATVIFIFGDQERSMPVWRTKAPDVDNSTKTILDVLVERGFIANDKLIVDLNAMKMQGRHAGIAVKLQPAFGICSEFEQIASDGPEVFLAGDSTGALEIYPKPQPEGVPHAS